MTSIFHLSDWSYTFLIYAVWGLIPWSWYYTLNHSLRFSLRLLLSNRPFDFTSFPHLQSLLKFLAQSKSRPSSLLFSYALLEVLFSIYYCYQAKLAQRRIYQVQHSPEFLRSCILKVVGSGIPPDLGQQLDASFAESSNQQRTRLQRPVSPQTLAPTVALDFHDPHAVDFRSHVVIWFGKCEWEEICRDNFMEWLAWSLFSVHHHEIRDAAHHELIASLLSVFELRAGAKLPPGYNSRLRPRVMRLTLDPVKVTSHPIGFYAAVQGLSWMVKRMLIKNGFTETQCTHRPDGLRYLIRKPDGWDQAPEKTRSVPFICIHGLGVGFIQYVAFLRYLAHSPWARSRPVMIPIQPSISSSSFSSQHLSPPSKEEMTSDMREVFRKEGFETSGADLFGHSNGTIVAAWIIKSMPHLVKRVCLVDPVCFCLWEGHVCHNFLYGTPQNGLERLMRYYIGTELGVAKYLHRHFDWVANILWPAELPDFKDGNRCSVFLAGRDSVLNAPRVRKYLLQNGMTEVGTEKGEPGQAAAGLVMAWDAAHGESLIEGHFERIKSWLERTT
ncbi:uncharacterized protein MELLADRAFT_116143 [Melampsora larici-populina 98AG31]|uniref:AB hydrolase-1 domain-containing protein n=1 Tax=Melampsora larici-populina (strain 98AG31 / pathotype 3-4-7) TaxID=747676 RepID=F4RI36_MELLP|nr:uncharacterized protein MELLADRAFT_116143 [Melampsora larici-populina 98AG31]EGG07931.1 hypothetical protein MELLADRAFT_116143 [Melampsora larici-populina 98AG31]